MKFQLKLALALGKTLSEVREINLEEFILWIAYDAVEPFGEIRADYRSAINAYTTASVFGAKAKLKDFMPSFEEPVMMDAEQGIEMMKAWAMKANQAMKTNQGVK